MYDFAEKIAQADALEIEKTFKSSITALCRIVSGLGNQYNFLRERF